VHKNALEITGILHRDISPTNLFLAFAKGRTDHKIHMDDLPDDVQARLCHRIKHLEQRGVLGDWGYATPKMALPTPIASDSSDSEVLSLLSGDSSPGDIPTSPVAAASCEPVMEYDNRVPIRKVRSNDVPKLLSVSSLTNEHDIVLLMGGDNPDEDPR
jgi:hypothetical protein